MSGEANGVNPSGRAVRWNIAPLSRILSAEDARVQSLRASFLHPRVDTKRVSFHVEFRNNCLVDCPTPHLIISPVLLVRLLEPNLEISCIVDPEDECRVYDCARSEANLYWLTATNGMKYFFINEPIYIKTGETIQITLFPNKECKMKILPSIAV